MIAGGFIALTAGEPGIYAFELTTTGLELSPRLAPLERVSALVADERRRTLFAAYSTPTEGEAPGGRVVRYRFEPDHPAELTLLAEVASGGTTPCHLAVAGDRLFVANFRAFGAPGAAGASSQGNLGVLRTGGDDRLAFEHSVSFPGSSVHPERQTCSHPHCVLPFIDESILVADLGTDRVWRYRYGADAFCECALDLPPESGPRHIARSPDGRSVYVVNEIASTLVACSVSPEGGLRVTGEASTLPEPAKGESAAGDVAVTADGALVLATNRGQHSVAVVAPGNRRPVVLDYLHLDASPGDFALSTTGYLLVPVGARLVVFRVDEPQRRLTSVCSHELPGRIGALCCRR